MGFKMNGFPKFDFQSKKPKNTKNYKKEMDLNADKYGPSAGETVAGNKFKFTQDDRPNPTYEGTDEYRAEKDISNKEKKNRGVLQKGWHGAKGKPNLKLMAESGAASLTTMANSAAAEKYKEVDLRKKSGKGPRA